MMRNLTVALCLAATLVACDKVEHTLDGKWQLETVEANGEIQVVDTVWYNFQTSLFQYQLYDAAHDVYRSNYGYKTLVEDTRLELELVTYGQPVESFLPYTDWTAPKRTFTIEESSATRLVLSDDGKRYSFKKF